MKVLYHINYNAHELSLSWQLSIYSILNKTINDINDYKKYNYISNNQNFLTCWFTTIIAIIKNNNKNCITCSRKQLTVFNMLDKLNNYITIINTNYYSSDQSPNAYN